MSNRVTFGLRNVKYAKANIIDGEISYEAVKSLAGAVELSMDSGGANNSVYADDNVAMVVGGYLSKTLSLKLTEIPDEFLIDILGYQRTEDGGLVETTDTPTIPFALGFEMQGDAEARRIWYFLCSVSPIAYDTKTNTESVEANSRSLDIQAYVVNVCDESLVRVIASRNDDNYSGFLEAVPRARIEESFLYTYNPTKVINTSGFVVESAPTSTVGSYKGDEIYTRGYKIATYQSLEFSIPEGNKAQVVMYLLSNQIDANGIVNIVDKDTSRVVKVIGGLALKNAEYLTCAEFELACGRTYTITRNYRETQVFAIKILLHRDVE